LWLVEINASGPCRIRALPLALDYCFTRHASADEDGWIERRMRDLCASFGSAVEPTGGLIDVSRCRSQEATQTR
jgi:poly-gamma-glutamate synthesis protein (capsule biosynthesis protein)